MKGYLQQMSKEERDRMLGYAKVQLSQNSKYKHIPQEKIRFIEIVCPNLEEDITWDRLESFWVDSVYEDCLEIPCDMNLLDINGDYIETKEGALSQFYLVGEPFWGDRDWSDYDGDDNFTSYGFIGNNKATSEFLSDRFESTYGTSSPSILDDDTEDFRYRFLFTTEDFDFVEKLDLHNVKHTTFPSEVIECMIENK